MLPLTVVPNQVTPKNPLNPSGTVRLIDILECLTITKKQINPKGPPAKLAFNRRRLG